MRNKRRFTAYQIRDFLTKRKVFTVVTPAERKDALLYIRMLEIEGYSSRTVDGEYRFFPIPEDSTTKSNGSK